MAGVVTSATYYSAVRVPLSALVGAENQGWPLITNQLNHERVALTSAAPVLSALASVREWARDAKLADGRRVIDAEWVRLNLARVHAKAEFLKLMNWRIASSATAAAAPPGGDRARRGVGHEGVRHRVRRGGVPAADGGARRRARWCVPVPPVRRWPGGSSASTAPR